MPLRPTISKRKLRGLEGYPIVILLGLLSSTRSRAFSVRQV